MQLLTKSCFPYPGRPGFSPHSSYQILDPLVCLSLGIYVVSPPLGELCYYPILHRQGVIG